MTRLRKKYAGYPTDKQRAQRKYAGRLRAIEGSLAQLRNVTKQLNMEWLHHTALSNIQASLKEEAKRYYEEDKKYIEDPDMVPF